MKKKALVIVAHPDDETIWMGGLILQKKNWDWTIFSLCRADDKDRAPKFKKVCDLLGAKSFISDLDDEVLNSLNSEEIASRILENFENKEFDFVFTHGKNGEYGHIRHREIHDVVKKIVGLDDLKCEKLFCFSYISKKESAPHDGTLKIPIANLGADLIVNLSEKDLSEKRRIVEEVYGFRHPIFETLACGGAEAFDEV